LFCFFFKLRQDYGNLKAFLARYANAAPPKGWMSLRTIAKIDMLSAGNPDTSENLTFEDLIPYWNLLRRNIDRYYEAELEEVRTTYLHTVALESIRIAKSKIFFPFFLFDSFLSIFNFNCSQQNN
jgi:hypothetical protein